MHANKETSAQNTFITQQQQQRMVWFINYTQLYPYENVCMAADGSLMFILLIAACLIVHFVSFARTRNSNIKSNLLSAAKHTQPEI